MDAKADIPDQTSIPVLETNDEAINKSEQTEQKNFSFQSAESIDQQAVQGGSQKQKASEVYEAQASTAIKESSITNLPSIAAGEKKAEEGSNEYERDAIRSVQQCVERTFDTPYSTEEREVHHKDEAEANKGLNAESSTISDEQETAKNSHSNLPENSSVAEVNEQENNEELDPKFKVIAEENNSVEAEADFTKTVDRPVKECLVSMELSEDGLNDTSNNPAETSNIDENKDGESPTANKHGEPEVQDQTSDMSSETKDEKDVASAKESLNDISEQSLESSSTLLLKEHSTVEKPADVLSLPLEALDERVTDLNVEVPEHSDEKTNIAQPVVTEAKSLEENKSSEELVRALDVTPEVANLEKIETTDSHQDSELESPHGAAETEKTAPEVKDQTDTTPGNEDEKDIASAKESVDDISEQDPESSSILLLKEHSNVEKPVDVSSLLLEASEEKVTDMNIRVTEHCDEKTNIAPPLVTEATSLEENRLSEESVRGLDTSQEAATPDTIENIDSHRDSEVEPLHGAAEAEKTEPEVEDQTSGTSSTTEFQRDVVSSKKSLDEISEQNLDSSSTLLLAEHSIVDKPTDVSSLLPEASDESVTDVNTGVIEHHDEKINVAPTVVTEATSLEEYDPNEESVRALDASSEAEPLETIKTTDGHQDSEANSTELGETSWVVGQLPTLEDDKANNGVFLQEKSGLGDIEDEETTIPDAKSESNEIQGLEEVQETDTNLIAGHSNRGLDPQTVSELKDHDSEAASDNKTSAPAEVTELTSFTDVQQSNELVKEVNTSSAAENLEESTIAHTSQQDAEVDDMKQEETCHTVYHDPKYEHDSRENASTTEEKSDTTIAENAKTKTPDEVSESEHQSVSEIHDTDKSPAAGETGADEIKSETEVSEAVFAGQTEITNERTVEEESSRKEHPELSVEERSVNNADRDPNIIQSDQVTSFTDGTTETEISNTADHNQDSGASTSTKALEEEVGEATQKPVDLSISGLVASEEYVNEVNVEVKEHCDENTTATPTVVTEAISLEEDQLNEEPATTSNEEPASAFHESSEATNTDTLETTVRHQDSEVDSMKLEETSSIGAQLPIHENENAKNGSEKETASIEEVPDNIEASKSEPESDLRVVDGARGNEAENQTDLLETTGTVEDGVSISKIDEFKQKAGITLTEPEESVVDESKDAAPTDTSIREGKYEEDVAVTGEDNNVVDDQHQTKIHHKEQSEESFVPKNEEVSFNTEKSFNAAPDIETTASVSELTGQVHEVSVVHDKEDKKDDAVYESSIGTENIIQEHNATDQAGSVEVASSETETDTDQVAKDHGLNFEGGPREINDEDGMKEDIEQKEQAVDKQFQVDSTGDDCDKYITEEHPTSNTTSLSTVEESDCHGQADQNRPNKSTEEEPYESDTEEQSCTKSNEAKTIDEEAIDLDLTPSQSLEPAASDSSAIEPQIHQPEKDLNQVPEAPPSTKALEEEPENAAENPIEASSLMLDTSDEKVKEVNVEVEEYFEGKTNIAPTLETAATSLEEDKLNEESIRLLDPSPEAMTPETIKMADGQSNSEFYTENLEESIHVPTQFSKEEVQGANSGRFTPEKSGTNDVEDETTTPEAKLESNKDQGVEEVQVTVTSLTAEDNDRSEIKELTREVPVDFSEPKDYGATADSEGETAASAVITELKSLSEVQLDTSSSTEHLNTAQIVDIRQQDGEVDEASDATAAESTKVGTPDEVSESKDQADTGIHETDISHPEGEAGTNEVNIQTEAPETVFVGETGSSQIEIPSKQAIEEGSCREEHKENRDQTAIESDEATASTDAAAEIEISKEADLNQPPAVSTLEMASKEETEKATEELVHVSSSCVDAALTGEDNFVAEDQRQNEAQHEELSEESFIQKPEAGNGNKENLLDVASDVEGTACNTASETITSIKDAEPVEIPRSISWDTSEDAVVPDDIEKNTTPEEENLSLKYVDEKTSKVDTELFSKNGNDTNFDHPIIAKTVHVIGEKQNEASMSNLEGQVHEVLVVDIEEDKNDGETCGASKGTENAILEDITSERAVSIDMASTKSEVEVDQLEKDHILHSEGELMVIDTECGIKQHIEQREIAADKETGLETRGDNIEKFITEEELPASDKSSLGTVEESDCLGQEDQSKPNRSSGEEKICEGNGEQLLAEEDRALYSTNVVAGEEQETESSQEDATITKITEKEVLETNDETRDIVEDIVQDNLTFQSAELIDDQRVLQSTQNEQPQGNMEVCEAAQARTAIEGVFTEDRPPMTVEQKTGKELSEENKGDATRSVEEEETEPEGTNQTRDISSETEDQNEIPSPVTPLNAVPQENFESSYTVPLEEHHIVMDEVNDEEKEAPERHQTSYGNVQASSDVTSETEISQVADLNQESEVSTLTKVSEEETENAREKLEDISRSGLDISEETVREVNVEVTEEGDGTTGIAPERVIEAISLEEDELNEKVVEAFDVSSESISMDTLETTDSTKLEEISSAVVQCPTYETAKPESGNTYVEILDGKDVKVDETTISDVGLESENKGDEGTHETVAGTGLTGVNETGKQIEVPEATCEPTNHGVKEFNETSSSLHVVDTDIKGTEKQTREAPEALFQPTNNAVEESRETVTSMTVIDSDISEKEKQIEEASESFSGPIDQGAGAAVENETFAPTEVTDVASVREVGLKGEHEKNLEGTSEHGAEVDSMKLEDSSSMVPTIQRHEHEKTWNESETAEKSAEAGVGAEEAEAADAVSELQIQDVKEIHEINTSPGDGEASMNKIEEQIEGDFQAVEVNDTATSQTPPSEQIEKQVNDSEATATNENTDDSTIVRDNAVVTSVDVEETSNMESQLSDDVEVNDMTTSGAISERNSGIEAIHGEIDSTDIILRSNIATCLPVHEQETTENEGTPIEKAGEVDVETDKTETPDSVPEFQALDVEGTHQTNTSDKENESIIVEKSDAADIETTETIPDAVVKDEKSNSDDFEVKDITSDAIVEADNICVEEIYAEVHSIKPVDSSGVVSHLAMQENEKTENESIIVEKSNAADVETAETIHHAVAKDEKSSSEDVEVKDITTLDAIPEPDNLDVEEIHAEVQSVKLAESPSVVSHLLMHEDDKTENEKSIIVEISDAADVETAETIPDATVKAEKSSPGDVEVKDIATSSAIPEAASKGDEETNAEVQSMKLEESSGMVSHLPTQEHEKTENESIIEEKAEPTEVETSETIPDAVVKDEKSDSDVVEAKDITSSGAIPEAENVGVEEIHAEVRSIELGESSGVVSHLPMQHEKTESESIIMEKPDPADVETAETIPDAVVKDEKADPDDVEDQDITTPDAKPDGENVGAKEINIEVQNIKLAESSGVVSNLPTDEHEKTENEDIIVETSHVADMETDETIPDAVAKDEKSNLDDLEVKDIASCDTKAVADNTGVGEIDAEVQSKKLEESSGVVSHLPTHENEITDNGSIIVEKSDAQDVEAAETIPRAVVEDVREIYETCTSPNHGEANVDEIKKQDEVLETSRNIDVATTQILHQEEIEKQIHVSSSLFLPNQDSEITVITEDGIRVHDKGEFAGLAPEETSREESPLSVTKGESANSTTMEKSNPDDVVEVGDVRTVDAVQERNNSGIEEIHATGASQTAEGTGTDKNGKANIEESERTAGPKYQIVEVDDGQTSDQPLPVIKLLEELQASETMVISEKREDPTDVEVDQSSLKLTDDILPRSPTTENEQELTSSASTENADSVEVEAREALSSEALYEAEDGKVEEVHDIEAIPTVGGIQKDGSEEETETATYTPKEEDHVTVTKFEMITAGTTNTDEADLSENAPDSFEKCATEKPCLQDNITRELQVSDLDVAARTDAAETELDGQNAAQREPLLVEHQTRVPAKEYADSPRQSEESIIRESDSKEDDVSDIQNQNSDSENLLKETGEKCVEAPVSETSSPCIDSGETEIKEPLKSAISQHSELRDANNHTSEMSGGQATKQDASFGKSFHESEDDGTYKSIIEPITAEDQTVKDPTQVLVGHSLDETNLSGQVKDGENTGGGEEDVKLDLEDQRDETAIKDKELDVSTVKEQVKESITELNDFEKLQETSNEDQGLQSISEEKVTAENQVAINSDAHSPNEEDQQSVADPVFYVESGKAGSNINASDAKGAQEKTGQDITTGTTTPITEVENSEVISGSNEDRTNEKIEMPTELGELQTASLPIFSEQAAENAHQSEITQDADSNSSKDFPSMLDNTAAKTFQEAEVQAPKAGVALGTESEVEAPHEKSTVARENKEQVEKDTAIDSDGIQSSNKETPQAVQTAADEKESQALTAELAQVEAEKTDEEEEGDEHNGTTSSFDSPVMVEASSREIEVKTPPKKSHNILSGVGSKVKHSIAKVKKVITGKSPNQKTSPKEDKKQVSPSAKTQ